MTTQLADLAQRSEPLVQIMLRQSKFSAGEFAIMSKTRAFSTIVSGRELPEFRLDLGVQYSSGSRYPAALEPEIRLMVMILEDALQCYQRYYGARHVLRRREFRDAKRWIFGPDEDWIFSFNHICASIASSLNIFAMVYGDGKRQRPI